VPPVDRSARRGAQARARIRRCRSCPTPRAAPGDGSGHADGGSARGNGPPPAVSGCRTWSVWPAACCGSFPACRPPGSGCLRAVHHRGDQRALDVVITMS
jgi:hypothetical protein